MSWAWELVWMMLILKIPIVYLCCVIWWALRSPRPLEHARKTVRPDVDPSRGSWRATHFAERRRRPRTGPHGTPRRGPMRARVARAETDRR